jgi:hypothetical protein
VWLDFVGMQKLKGLRAFNLHHESRQEWAVIRTAKPQAVRIIGFMKESRCTICSNAQSHFWLQKVSAAF